ncbi:restriction endonuclease subunit S [Paucibacter sp. APW11]|uniref:Restriction endonuclease subunit S n=1 Tax=Roseateles aquae TaxID=3077235 RepID=A0ABU3PIQ8_9BURK|nr:restriction endonuclease subunit S [Paucibacter sp. APW11]MDT9002330.1 restriction endonuclease subunit S [Paucibacter sp. APW11]
MPMLSARNINNGLIHFDNYRFISQADFDLENKRTQVEANDLLLTIVGTIGRVAVVPKDAPPFALQRSVAVLRPMQGVSTRYLAYALASPNVQQHFLDTAKGTAQKGIYLKALGALELLIAPPAEQTRIADHLDTLLARIKACNDHLDAIPGLLKRFRQAVLDAATLGNLTADWREVNCSEPWTPVSLRDIAQVIGGVTKDSKKQSVADEEVPYLRVANVQRGYLDLAEIKTIRVPKAKLESLLLQPGDILFNEGGDLDKLGRGWIWEGQITRCTFQNHVFRARLLDPRNEPKFISWWGNSRGLDYFIRSGKQTTNLASINKTMLEALPISLPSPEEQKEIVRCVETLFGIADRIEVRYLAAKSLANRLAPQSLAKAFRGDLLPQDPNDEPASALLARLAEERNQASAAPKARKARAPRAERALPSTSFPSQAMPNKSRQDEDVKGQPYLAGHLRRLGQPVDAKTLYEASELPVADFYKQLAWEIAEGHVKDADPLLEPARHAA